MNNINRSEPATKGDLTDGLTGLNKKIDSVKTSLNKKIDSVETSLNKKIDSVKTELKTDIGKVWMEMGAMRMKIDRMEEKMSTKDDTSRIMNHIDKFAAEALSYRNHDILRGRAIMDHDDKFKDHESRITALETK